MKSHGWVAVGTTALGVVAVGVLLKNAIQVWFPALDYLWKYMPESTDMLTVALVAVTWAYVLLTARLVDSSRLAGAAETITRLREVTMEHGSTMEVIRFVIENGNAEQVGTWNAIFSKNQFDGSAPVDELNDVIHLFRRDLARLPRELRQVASEFCEGAAEVANGLTRLEYCIRRASETARADDWGEAIAHWDDALIVRVVPVAPALERVIDPGLYEATEAKRGAFLDASLKYLGERS
jgi:hypothetical protein